MKVKWLFIISIAFSLLVTLLIFLLNYRFENIYLLPDQGVSWYYWKLPERDFWVMFIVWIMYAAHQITIWVLLVKQRKTKSIKDTVVLMSVNAAFILLHLLQSHIWYDGLAQDVPVWSSQGSVIVMLVLVLLMDNKRRGLFFGYRLKGFNDITIFVRKYHGYFISWAVIYTFWYHPMVSTNGHLMGFFYMFLLFTQLSMAYTKVHTNKYWMFLLEIMVLIHGTTVAIDQGQNMWPMFLFGFGFIMIATQIYGLGLSKTGIRIIQGIYVLAVIYIFGFSEFREIRDIHQILWIPVIEYGLVLLFMVVGEQLLKKGK